jgi:hypothetical protein
MICSCAPSFRAPQVTVDEARHLVATYIGNHAWDITFDSAHDQVRDQVLYYAVKLGGTSQGDPAGFLVDSQTGDLFDLNFHLEQHASALLQADAAPAGGDALPAEYSGSFAIGDDPLAGEIGVNQEGFSLGDDGSIMKGQIGDVTTAEGVILFTVTGSLHIGQDESSKEYSGSWKVSLSLDDDNLTLNGISGPGPLSEAFSGKVFHREH